MKSSLEIEHCRAEISRLATASHSGFDIAASPAIETCPCSNSAGPQRSGSQTLQRKPPRRESRPPGPAPRRGHSGLPLDVPPLGEESCPILPEPNFPLVYEIEAACGASKAATIDGAMQRLWNWVFIAEREIWFMALQDEATRIGWWAHGENAKASDFFGAYKENRFWTVFGVYQLLKKRLSGQDPVGTLHIRCTDAPMGSSAEADTCNELCASGLAGCHYDNNQIRLCPEFFNLPSEGDRSELLLHEILHKLGWGVGHKNGNANNMPALIECATGEDQPDGYAPYCSSLNQVRALAMQRPNEAVLSIDNYVHFSRRRRDDYVTGICNPSQWR